MEALYAFLRLSDDLADEPGELSAKRQRLQIWRMGLLEALRGRFNHPIHPALIETVRRFDIPAKLLLDALDGVESDVEPKRFATFADLYPYCYKVASVVGLSCIRIWGFRPGIAGEEVRLASAAAEAAGIAFQLTNILRDLNEDYDRGRVYLPMDELNQLAELRENWRESASDSRVLDMIRFQACRAKSYYRLARPLDRFLCTDGRAIFRVMMGTYLKLLEEIEKDIPAIFRKRVRVPRWRKGLILLSGWAIKFGWL